MIPKIIHYCWLSNDPFPDKIQQCINSWKKVLPDYEFMKWDTKRFDINSVPYVKEAFEAKKYAFCADYIRIYALYNYGGIYLDSDVMVYQPFDPFLKSKGFASVEFHNDLLYAHVTDKKRRMIGIEAAVLGAEKKSQWLKDILDYYVNRHFSLKEKDLKNNIMPRLIASVLHEKYGFKHFPIFQKLSNGLEIYPAEVFSSKEAAGTPIKYSSHLCANSWQYTPHRNKLRSILAKMHLLDFLRRLRGIER